MPGGSQMFVLDTSSLLDVRKVFGQADERRVFAVLTTLVKGGQIVYPAQVGEEILRGREREPDAACRWIERTKPAAERRADYDLVRRLLKVAPDLLDPDIPHDQADPYVIALALAMRTEELTFDTLASAVAAALGARASIAATQGRERHWIGSRTAGRAWPATGPGRPASADEVLSVRGSEGERPANRVFHTDP